ncbi:MAG: NADH:ubiquinone reductase (Na(+)-transporting) subunit A [Deltaproteobacteria bacterium]|nr:NADH:ubiquinone reductase (Na(+)-transporting) subunit A [Deltaproteobacteria bacterium]
MHDHVMKRGLNLPLAGGATGEPVELPPPATVAYSPEEMTGIFPKLTARVGDEVKRGQVLFFNKYAPEVKFLSPVTGKVKEIRRGARRVITDFIIERSESEEAVSFKRWSMGDLEGISRDLAQAGLAEGGMWPLLRTRPLDQIATYGETPQAILVHATETGPLMPGADVLIGQDEGEALQAGLYVLRALTDGATYLTVPKGTTHKALTGLKGVEVHGFAGAHPTGDPAVQVNLLQPPKGAGKVWYISAWDAVLVGRLFLEGMFPNERVYAAVGGGLKAPRYVRTLVGAPIAHILGELHEGPQRVIRGSVLTGDAIDGGRWASLYRRAISVIPDTASQELFGWTTPQFNKYSASRTSFVGLLGAGRVLFNMTTAMFGGHRAMLPNPIYSKVILTPEIQPEFLFRSIFAGDLEDAITLGMLDLSMEEAALMTFVCPTKNEYGVALTEAIAQYIKES